jgi:hypothetical protein
MVIFGVEDGPFARPRIEVLFGRFRRVPQPFGLLVISGFLDIYPGQAYPPHLQSLVSGYATTQDLTASRRGLGSNNFLSWRVTSEYGEIPRHNFLIYAACVCARTSNVLSRRRLVHGD